MKSVTLKFHPQYTKEISTPLTPSRSGTTVPLELEIHCDGWVPYQTGE